jgi:hypothetical protein
VRRYGAIAKALLEREDDMYSTSAPTPSASIADVERDARVTVHAHELVPREVDGRDEARMVPFERAGVRVASGNGRILVATNEPIGPGALGAPLLGATGFLRAVVEGVVAADADASAGAGVVVCVDAIEVGRFLGAIEAKAAQGTPKPDV